jgi:hypothetical protein
VLLKESINVFIYNILFALLQVVYLVKASILKIGMDDFANNGLTNFVPRLSIVLEIAYVFLESTVLPLHLVDTLRCKHCVFFYSVYLKAVYAYALLAL